MPAFVLLSPSDLEQRSKQEMTLQPGWGLRERTLSKFLSLFSTRILQTFSQPCEHLKNTASTPQLEQVLVMREHRTWPRC